jgi:hypothetical protein
VAFVPDWRLWTLMLLPLAVAVLVVWVRQGSPRGLLGLRLRGVWLIWAAALVQFSRVVGVSSGLSAVLMIWVFGAAFVAVNLRGRPRGARVGLVLLVVGFTLNTLVIAVNGKMPFSASAARAVGFSERAIAEGNERYAAVSDQTALVAFADVIPVPVLRSVVSVGDLLMFAGIATLLVALAAAARPAPPAALPPR